MMNSSGGRHPDIDYEPVKGGIHAGGQHAQKNATGVRAVHRDTGTTVVVRGRSLKDSIREATGEIWRRLRTVTMDREAARAKARRDEAIKPSSYDYKTGRVTDHRTGKTASIKQIVVKGQLDRLR